MSMIPAVIGFGSYRARVLSGRRRVGILAVVAGAGTGMITSGEHQI
jgi:hypothetical protein